MFAAYNAVPLITCVFAGGIKEKDVRCRMLPTIVACMFMYGFAITSRLQLRSRCHVILRLSHPPHPQGNCFSPCLSWQGDPVHLELFIVLYVIAPSVVLPGVDIPNFLNRNTYESCTPQQPRLHAYKVLMFTSLKFSSL